MATAADEVVTAVAVEPAPCVDPQAGTALAGRAPAGVVGARAALPPIDRAGLAVFLAARVPGTLEGGVAALALVVAVLTKQGALVAIAADAAVRPIGLVVMARTVAFVLARNVTVTEDAGVLGNGHSLEQTLAERRAR